MTNIDKNNTTPKIDKSTQPREEKPEESVISQTGMVFDLLVDGPDEDDDYEQENNNKKI